VTTNERKTTNSEALFDKACRTVAGGESSGMRVLPYQLPLVIDRAEGARIWDVDGNELIDMNMAYGPLVFGHRAAPIVEAIEADLARRGPVLGLAHELSHEVAELVHDAMPSVELLRFCSTGSEAGQTAVRLARAFTGRTHLVAFEGHYHGSTDALYHRYHAPIEDLDAAGPERPIPGTSGMGGAPHNLFVVPWNDMPALQAILDKHADKIAAVIMEPVMGNSGVIAPNDGYLKQAAAATRKIGALLIFDEVITGFRIARGGAQSHYDVKADLTMLGKAISGGVPCCAVGGRRDILQQLVDRKVSHGGVYSGNPMSLAAAFATQTLYKNDKTVHEKLWRAPERILAGLRSIFQEVGVPVLGQHVGGELSCWFLHDKSADVKRFESYRDAARHADAQRYIKFQNAVQGAGVYFHPNHMEQWFLSTEHTDAVIDIALERIRGVAKTFDWRR
jgi:glutamate-1-semialdehyde 2,1-aminomutase